MTIVTRSYSHRLKIAGKAGQARPGQAGEKRVREQRERPELQERIRDEGYRREDCQHASGFGKRSASSSISVSFKAAFIPTTVRRRSVQ